MASPAVFAADPSGVRGGDGTEGFVADGVGPSDGAASVSNAGDVNGDGIDDLIIGATEADPRQRFQAGVTYVVFGRDTAMTGDFPALYPLENLLPDAGGDGSAGFVLAGVRESDNSGAAVSNAGDVNGDGTDDLLVAGYRAGAPFRRGETYLVFGRASGFPATIDLRSLFPPDGGDGSAGTVLPGVNQYGSAGYSVSAAGDVNGDGLDDIVIGAPQSPEGKSDAAGESYVVFGRASGFPPILPMATLFPAGGGDGSAGFVLRGVGQGQAGIAVSSAGDVNGDGIDDLIVGAHGVGEARGATYVLFGRTSGFPAILSLRGLSQGDGSGGFVLVGDVSFEYAGRSVSGAGDVNGDGIDDLLIGAPCHSFYNFTDGKIYVLFGRTTGFPATFPLGSLRPRDGGDGSEGFVLVGISAVDGAGSAVSDAGDVNGDGVDDILIGARQNEPYGRNNAGQSYLVFGRTTGFPAEFDLRDLLPVAGGDGSEGMALNGGERDRSGHAVSGAGDINADGLADLMIGALGESNSPRVESKSYIVFGRTTDFPAVLELRSLLPP